MGVTAILAQDPHSRPATTDRSPAPFVHASDEKTELEFRAQYRAFVDAFRCGSTENVDAGAGTGGSTSAGGATGGGGSAAMPEAGVATGGASGVVDAGIVSPGGSGGAPAGTGGSTFATGGTTEAEGASNAGAHAAAGSSGCSFAPNRGSSPTSAWGWLLLAAMVLQARRRKRR
jgi:MYXO-CTERM domain-containing protein